MNIVSAIKLVRNVIPKNNITMRDVARGVNTTRRIFNSIPELILSTTSADTFVRSTREGFISAIKNGKPIRKSLWQAVKEGGGKVAVEIANATRKDGSIWTRMWKSLKSTPSVIKASAKEGAELAKAAGKSSIWGGTKGFVKGIGKKMPLIGNIIMVATELPNIFKATKEQGIGQGLKEVVKTTSRLTGASIGAAIGSMVCPGIGSLIGWCVGDWLTSKVVGKSYTEKQDEIVQKQQEALETIQQMGIDPQALVAQQQGAIQTPVQIPVQPQQQTVPLVTNPFVPYKSPEDMLNGNLYSSPYADDIMMKGMKFNTIG